MRRLTMAAVATALALGGTAGAEAQVRSVHGTVRRVPERPAPPPGAMARGVNLAEEQRLREEQARRELEARRRHGYRYDGYGWYDAYGRAYDPYGGRHNDNPPPADHAARFDRSGRLDRNGQYDRYGRLIRDIPRADTETAVPTAPRRTVIIVRTPTIQRKTTVYRDE